tara:strand:- start:435 stop:989 length:555 start_codon:yes stop_codon:yes gene_type:complete
MYNFIESKRFDADLFDRAYEASKEDASEVASDILETFKEEKEIDDDDVAKKQFWKELVIEEQDQPEDGYYMTGFKEDGQQLGLCTFYKEDNKLVYRTGLLLPIDGTKRWCLTPELFQDNIQWCKDNFDCDYLEWLPDNRGTFWAGLKASADNLRNNGLVVTLTEEALSNPYSNGFYGSILLSKE